MLLYDCEIIKCIPSKNNFQPDLEYCEGWTDFKGMGVSCICAYDYIEKAYRVFMEDNFGEFQYLLDERHVIAGFNSQKFDDRLLEANGFKFDAKKSYDILVEIWKGAGLGPKFNPRTHGGFNLNKTHTVNFGPGKDVDGAMAPIMFQKGKIGSLIDYCLRDVMMSKAILDLIMRTGKIINPKQGGVISVEKPPFVPLDIESLAIPNDVLQPIKRKQYKISTMPFGKHKGLVISEIPTEYIRWALGEDWFVDKYADLAEAFEEELSTRD